MHPKGDEKLGWRNFESSIYIETFHRITYKTVIHQETATVQDMRLAGSLNKY